MAIGKGFVARLRANWDFIAFTVGLAVMVFLAGMLFGILKVFPYPVVRAAVYSAGELRKYFDTREREDLFLVDSAGDDAGVLFWDRTRALDGVTFMTLRRGDRFGASLIDMSGNEIHRWDLAFSDVWADPEHVVTRASDAGMMYHGAHLFPNGDVVFNFTGATFPKGAGLVRMDRCSNVLWAVAENTHHAVDVAPDGTIWTLGHWNRTNSDARFPKLTPPFVEDYFLRVSPGGNVQQRVSVLDVIFQSGFESILQFNAGTGGLADPLHTNDIEVLTSDLAPAFPMFEAGDLMISIRRTSTLMVVDPESNRVRWAQTGPFISQHDPDFLPNGNILVYDNRTDKKTSHRFGYSRVLEFDQSSHRVVWSFSGTDAEPF